jgi:hypothetical protein
LTWPTRTTSANRFLPQLANRTQLSLCVVAFGTATFSNADAKPENIKRRPGYLLLLQRFLGNLNYRRFLPA